MKLHGGRFPDQRWEDRLDGHRGGQVFCQQGSLYRPAIMKKFSPNGKVSKAIFQTLRPRCKSFPDFVRDNTKKLATKDLLPVMFWSLVGLICLALVPGDGKDDVLDFSMYPEPSAGPSAAQLPPSFVETQLLSCTSAPGMRFHYNGGWQPQTENPQITRSSRDAILISFTSTDEKTSAVSQVPSNVVEGGLYLVHMDVEVANLPRLEVLRPSLEEWCSKGGLALIAVNVQDNPGGIDFIAEYNGTILSWESRWSSFKVCGQDPKVGFIIVGKRAVLTKTLVNRDEHFSKQMRTVWKLYFPNFGGPQNEFLLRGREDAIFYLPQSVITKHVCAQILFLLLWYVLDVFHVFHAVPICHVLSQVVAVCEKPMHHHDRSIYPMHSQWK